MGVKAERKRTKRESNDDSGPVTILTVLAFFILVLATVGLLWSRYGGSNPRFPHMGSSPSRQQQAMSTVQEFQLHIPRVTVQELQENGTLQSGLHAYVVVGAANKWKAINWTLKAIKKKIPYEWVDYYKESLPTQGHKPYLFKVGDAIPQFMDSSPHPRYMQIRLGLPGWRKLRKDLEPMPLEDVFWGDDVWIKDCMKSDDGALDELAVDNFYTTNQWKFLLIGEKGTSMFFHKDHLAASSWQAQLVGRKQWTLCPNSESHLLSTELDTFNPDYRYFPQFARALCGQVTAEPGDFLYYPAYFWHHARQLDTPTMAYTGLLVGNERKRRDISGTVHGQMYRDLRAKCQKCWTKGRPDRHCDDISTKWPGAAPPPSRVVCDKYIGECKRLWDKHADELENRRSDL